MKGCNKKEHFIITDAKTATKTGSVHQLVAMTTPAWGGLVLKELKF